MKLKKLFFFSFLLIGLFLSLSCKEEGFIISSNKRIKKKSKNGLREDIGVQMKEALHCWVQLNKQVGKIQIELSDIQKQLFEKIEELIDNRPPFNKSSKANLLNSFEIMQSVKNELECQIDGIKKLSQKINNDICLGCKTG